MTTLLVGSTGGGLLSVRASGDTTIGDWGLIEVLSPVYWLSLFIPLLVFISELRLRRSSWLLSASLVAEVVLLHGAAAAAESVPRFVTAWLHAGFTNQIMLTGETVPDLDARFCWPGFFSTAAVFSSAVGVEPMALLRWAPVFFVLAYLPPLALLARSLHRSSTVMWATLWMFVALNWVGQDYFAPQSFGYLLFLTILSIICRVAAGRPPTVPAAATDAARRGRRLRARLERFSAPPSTAAPIGAAQRVTLLLLVVALCGVVAMSHQLTPFMLSAVLITIALIGAPRVGLLPVVTALITVAWVAFAAEPFWHGHLQMIFETFGKVQSTLGSSLEARLVGSEAHRRVLYVRIAFTVVIWASAGLAALLAVRRRRLSLPAAAMLLTPFSMLAVQSYGGEGMLRVYLFALPATALFLADLAVGLASAGRTRLIAVSLCVAATAPAFFVARYGNEAYERFTPGEISTINALHSVAPKGSTLVSLTPNIPWQSRGLTDYEYGPTARNEMALTRLDTIIDLMSNNPLGGYLVITRGQHTYAQYSYGLPVDWGQRMQREIHTSGRFDLVYSGTDGTIFRLRDSGGSKR